MNDSQFTPALFLLGFALGGLLAYLELLWLKRPLHLADHWPGLVLVALVNAGFIYLLIVAINAYYGLPTAFQKNGHWISLCIQPSQGDSALRRTQSGFP